MSNLISLASVLQLNLIAKKLATLLYVDIFTLICLDQQVEKVINYNLQSRKPIACNEIKEAWLKIDWNLLNRQWSKKHFCHYSQLINW